MLTERNTRSFSFLTLLTTAILAGCSTPFTVKLPEATPKRIPIVLAGM